MPEILRGILQKAQYGQPYSQSISSVCRNRPEFVGDLVSGRQIRGGQHTAIHCGSFSFHHCCSHALGAALRPAHPHPATAGAARCAAAGGNGPLPDHLLLRPAILGTAIDHRIDRACWLTPVRSRHTDRRPVPPRDHHWRKDWCRLPSRRLTISRIRPLGASMAAASMLGNIALLLNAVSVRTPGAHQRGHRAPSDRFPRGSTRTHSARWG